MAYLLSWIYDVVGNYGVSIIIFTIIVRLCLFPLYANQTKHQIKMMSVQPKMQALQKKYAHDKEELQRQMAVFMKEENFNPMRGCLPLIIQMPIIFGLFMLLRNPTAFVPNIDEMIFAVHENFLWIPDLSQPDLWILPTTTGVTQFISFSVSQSMSGALPGSPQAAQMQGMMKMMKYFFPIILVWTARNFPAGLALYWFTTNLFTVGQVQVLRAWRKKLEKMMKEGKGGKLFKKDKDDKNKK
jgi:YidC/Oxa1 family membrane protein insertase